MLLAKTGREWVFFVNELSTKYFWMQIRCFWKQIWCCMVSGNVLKKTAQTSSMLSTSVFSFNNLGRNDDIAPEWLKNWEDIPSDIFSSHSRSNKIYAPFFFYKIHHQNLIASANFLDQNILSSLRSRGKFFASRQQDSAQNVQENYIIRMQKTKAISTEICI